MRTLNMISRVRLAVFYFFLILSVVASRAIDAKAQSPNGFEVYLYSWADYEYEHPSSVTIGAQFLPEIFYNNHLLDLNAITEIEYINFYLAFDVTGALNEINYDLVSLIWGIQNESDYVNMTPAFIPGGLGESGGGGSVPALFIEIHDPIGFFTEMRTWYFWSNVNTGMPIAVIEGKDPTFYMGACGLPPFIVEDQCTHIQPIVAGGEISFFQGGPGPLGSETIGSEDCNFQISFPPCEGGSGNAEIVFEDPGSEGHLSIPELKNSGQNEAIVSFSVFPNPAQDYVDVFTENENMIIELFDLKGRLMQSLENQGRSMIRLSLGGFQQGYYFLRISTDTFVRTEKLVIARP